MRQMKDSGGELTLRLQSLTQRYRELGIAQQIDFDKFYLYSIVAHSTAIEGSTVTEIEAQLLFDEGITSSKRTWMEQMMNIDLKNAYVYGKRQIEHHPDITPTWLCALSAKVMEHTGSEYNALGGTFSAAKGELRKLNVTAGIGGRSYMSYLKVPDRLQSFCDELNHRRKDINKCDAVAAYELSFWAHYELVTIHPWADGNGRMARLLMNLLQMEQNVLPVKVTSSDKADYIQALIDTREADDISIFINFMAGLHCRNMATDIEQYLSSTEQDASDKRAIKQEASDKTSDKTQQILRFVSSHPCCRSTDVAAHLGLSQQRTRHYLAQLVKEERLQTQGANKNRVYSIRKETGHETDER